jgi:phosphatidylinositol alpha-1,6-mannosyltransferase
LPSILEKVPNAHLLLVGEGPHRKHLEELIQTLKLENHTTLIGRIQYAELPLYLCAGDVFVMPSRSRFFGLEVEGLGIVYLEASACGLPVIAGNSGGAPDAVIESQTGFVVDGTDIQEIANASVALLNDPALCAALGSAGREWIVEKWRWEIWSQQFETLLSK